MSDKKISNYALYWIVFGIIFVVGTVLAFLLAPEYTPTFWTSYIFTVIALVGLCISGTFLKDKFRNIFANIPFIYIAWFYLIIELIVTLLFGIIFTIPVTIYIAIHLILFAIFLILFILMIMGRRVIVEVHDSPKVDVQKKLNLIEDVKSIEELYVELPDDKRKELSRIIEAIEEDIRYSDPVVPPTLLYLDEEIKESLTSLYTEIENMKTAENVDVARVSQMAAKIKAKIAKRNRIIKAEK